MKAAHALEWREMSVRDVRRRRVESRNSHANVTIPYMLKTQIRTSMDKDALLIALVRRTTLQRGMIVIAM